MKLSLSEWSIHELLLLYCVSFKLPAMRSVESLKDDPKSEIKVRLGDFTTWVRLNYA
jgi:hypothetical protein